MNAVPERVFLLDVDNTLFDNDRLQADLRGHLIATLGAEGNQNYWQRYEDLRSRLGYADYLGAVQALRQPGRNDLLLPGISRFLLEYPFADALFEGTLDAIRNMERWGVPVILSDGDAVYQPYKIRGAGLAAAVAERVYIYIHKQHMLAQIERAQPARHYVMVDDKLGLLTAVKQAWGARVTTIFVRQGHYGRDTAGNARYPPPDLALDHIGDLARWQPAFAPQAPS
ncbi:HAD family hydrolase [Achromobacter aloeverae]|uniref:Haloacid dehalogenase n=1 Tax=Achromobacter aloeverae TaxID=1750518 RepID=A0A4Q1HJP3_9BURK|nr:HAD family hydrolase [Achromobacter aloeverae]RXN87933.1 haloacid dehalogenase [Achromobacter aloeverae]